MSGGRLWISTALFLFAATSSVVADDHSENVYRLIESFHTTRDKDKLAEALAQLRQINHDVLASQALKFHCDNRKLVDEGWGLILILQGCSPSSIVKAVSEGCDESNPTATRIPCEGMLRLAIQARDPNQVSRSPYRVLRSIFSANDRNVVRLLLEADPHNTFSGLWSETKNRIKERQQAVFLAHLVESYELRRKSHFPSENVRQEIGDTIEKLMSHDLWWVRLYAVEVMIRNPNLRSNQLAKYSKDPDPYVASRLGEVLKKSPVEEKNVRPLLNFRPIPINE